MSQKSKDCAMDLRQKDLAESNVLHYFCKSLNFYLTPINTSKVSKCEGGKLRVSATGTELRIKRQSFPVAAHGEMWEIWGRAAASPLMQDYLSCVTQSGGGGVLRFQQTLDLRKKKTHLTPGKSMSLLVEAAIRQELGKLQRIWHISVWCSIVSSWKNHSN